MHPGANPAATYVDRPLIKSAYETDARFKDDSYVGLDIDIGIEKALIAGKDSSTKSENLIPSILSIADRLFI